MSALSDVQIANLALAAVGARSTIVSMLEPSKEARACALQYPLALSCTLQAAHWNFARFQAALTLLKDGTLTPPDDVPQPWIYEYAYPSDCVQARYVMPMMQGNPGTVPGSNTLPYFVGSPVRFMVATDLDASGNRIKVILTNQPNAILVYTGAITDTSLFDDQFVRALANYLGHLVCIPVSGDKKMAADAFQIAQRTTIAAQASNGNEGLTVIDSIPDWLRVRGYASDWAYPPGSFFTVSPQSLSQVT